jgi:FlaA1/EpsC-like NDP-sugar epimerase
MPRSIKIALALSADIFSSVASVSFSYYLRLGDLYHYRNNDYNLLPPIIASIVIVLPIFVKFGLYREVYRFSGLRTFLTVCKAIGLYALIYFLILSILGSSLFIGIIGVVPRTIGLIQPLLLLFFVALTRGLTQYILGGAYQKRLQINSLPKALIYGAGSSGRKLAAALSASNEFNVLGFIDDDESIQNRLINGLIVFPAYELELIVKNLDVGVVLLALPSVSRLRQAEILSSLSTLHVRVHKIPSVSLLMGDNFKIADLQDLEIEDLLGRVPVSPNQELLERNIKNRTVMVTGAGGSIGSELCRQILQLNPKKLILIEQSEFALYSIYKELLNNHVQAKAIIVPLLGSVRDKRFIDKIFEKWRPATLYHAAAYKHVTLVQKNIAEGIRNNVFGTLVLVENALKYKVMDFVFISTDKAVRPTSIMGASKRLAEMIMQAISQTKNDTIFSIVRFGNVLGSSGSVVPLFKEQIRNGGPITLTDQNVSRFFMTITEASQLVLQAGAMASSGDLFVLDMGEPIRIRDLAIKMVHLSGLTIKNVTNPYGDIEIKIIGLQPGEKLKEELLIGDQPVPTEHPRVSKVREPFIVWDKLQIQLNSIEKLLDDDEVNELQQVLKRLIFLS